MDQSRKTVIFASRQILCKGKMNSLSSPRVDSPEDSSNFLDGSTAPTTPEGSYMSSPLLRPQALEALDMGITQTRPVRNICCVGAGYVGKRNGRLLRQHTKGHLLINIECRRPHGSRDRLQQPRHPRDSGRPEREPDQTLEQQAPPDLRARTRGDRASCSRWYARSGHRQHTRVSYRKYGGFARYIIDRPRDSRTG